MITISNKQVFINMLQSSVIMIICILIQNHEQLGYLDPIFSFIMVLIMASINLPIMVNCIYLMLDKYNILELIKSEIEDLPDVQKVCDIYGDDVLYVDVVITHTQNESKLEK